MTNPLKHNDDESPVSDFVSIFRVDVLNTHHSSFPRLRRPMSCDSSTAVSWTLKVVRAIGFISIPSLNSERMDKGYKFANNFATVSLIR